MDGTAGRTRESPRRRTSWSGWGIPDPALMVWLLIGFEVIGGIFLIFGLATRVISFGLMVLNIGIIVTLRSSTFYVHDSGWEYNAVMAVVGLMLMAHGAGRTGLDTFS